jgi:predicted dehydrogenase/aryl-alcohol dehydrogenase-like predicted oxidoreductase
VDGSRWESIKKENDVTKKLRWAIIGAGTISQTFAAGVAASRTGDLIAVGSRNQETADQFGERFSIPRRYGGYAAVLADPDVDAVYIATPHPFHAEWAIRAAEAGKHVLVEKPMGINHAEAMAVVEAARRNDVCLMEGYMYRCHPQTERLVELIRNRAIGAVRVIEAAFGFRINFSPEHRLLDHALAGGGILDVGGYPVSMARLIAGAASETDFADPIEVHGAAHIGAESRVDEWAVATLRFPNDIVAQVMCGIRVAAENVVRVFGDEGHIIVPAPWTLRGSSLTSKIIVHRSDEDVPREIVVEATADPWAIEADTVALHLDARQAATPAMSWDDSLGNLRTLDRWREAIGLVYDSERLEAPVKRLPARLLTVNDDHPMTYGEIAGVGKPISRLVMGVDNQTAMPHAAVMFDDFFEHGGTCFDTAYIYGAGRCEPVLGRWIEDRGVRDKVVILGKGGHTPYCTPEGISAQLSESLERLRTDHLDIYMLHRDNPAIPVDEFIDVLNEHQRAGRMRVFGASNWSIDRLEAANDYARRTGRSGFAAISNNFSLARMVAPPWPDCLSSSGATWRAWLTKTQMPLMPWSSQARGFFTGRAAPADFSDPELVRCWYSDDNFARLARVEQLAAERGVQPIAVALAWVLNQPFPTFPLIGPRTLSETRTSLPGLRLALTSEEVAWLNLEA